MSGATRSRAATRATAVIVGVLVACAITEIALRITGYPNSRWLMQSDAVLHHVHPPNGVHSPADGLPPRTLLFDAEGLRFDPALRVTDPAARFRVALMGDSFVEAAEVPYAESMSGLFEAWAGRSAEVRNFGVFSYSPMVYRVQWRVLVQKLRPTHVVLVLYKNDVDGDVQYSQFAKRTAGGDLAAIPAPGQVGLRGMLGRSRLARLFAYAGAKASWLWRNVSDDISENNAEDPEISELTGLMLLRLAREIQLSGARLFLTAVPPQPGEATDPSRTFAARCLAWASAHDVRFIDLTGPFRRAAAAGETLFVPNGVHWTAEGNRVAADTIRRALDDVFDAGGTAAGGSAR